MALLFVHLHSTFWFHCQLGSKSSDSEAYCVFVGFHFQKKWGKTNLALVDVPKKNLSLKFVWPFSVQLFFKLKKGTFHTTQDVNETVN